jgi:hypothetical protein
MKNLILTIAFFASVSSFAVQTTVQVSGKAANALMSTLKKAGAAEEHAMGEKVFYSATDVICRDTKPVTCDLSIQKAK